MSHLICYSMSRKLAIIMNILVDVTIVYREFCITGCSIINQVLVAVGVHNEYFKQTQFNNLVTRY